MSVLTMFTIPGDPDKLIADMPQESDEIEAAAREAGGLANVLAKDDQGIVMVSLWRDADGPHKLAEFIRSKGWGDGIPSEDHRRELEVVSVRGALADAVPSS